MYKIGFWIESQISKYVLNSHAVFYLPIWITYFSTVTTNNGCYRPCLGKKSCLENIIEFRGSIGKQVAWKIIYIYFLNNHDVFIEK